MNLSFRRRSIGVLLLSLAAPVPGWADAIYIDTILDPANYQTIIFQSTPALDITIQHLPAVPALQILYDLPIGSGDSMVGFIQPSFTYDPSTQGAIASVDATASRYLDFLADGFTLNANTWRPLIRQGGNYYMAVFPIVPPQEAVYQLGAALNLQPTDFGLFDFTTGAGPNFAVNPNFNAGLMQFGFASRFNWNVTQEVTVDARYRDLTIEVNAVPEPATWALVALGAGIGLRRRLRGRSPADRRRCDQPQMHAD